MTVRKNLGVKTNSKNPGSIANNEHDDPSKAGRELGGISGMYSPDNITADVADHAIPDDSILRIANDTGATVYLFIGSEDDVPGGAPDATNGIAILAGTAELIHCGCLNSAKSLVYKCSSASVQVIRFNQ